MNKPSAWAKRIPMWIGWLFGLWLAIHYWDQAVNLLRVGLNAASPLLTGMVIAYAVNIIMMALEERLLFPLPPRVRRPLSLLMALLLLFGLIATLIYLVLPQLWQCLELLTVQISDATNRLLPFVREWLPEDILNQPHIQTTLENSKSWFLSVAGGALNNVVIGLGSFISRAATTLIALIFSIYLLLGKERLLGQINRLLDIYLPKRFVSHLRYVAAIANNSFRRYIAGQCTEAIVLGILCILGMLVLRLPYAAMIGCVVGVTALIPFVGAYIGGAVGGIMVFTVSPMKALIFLVFLVVLQQVEDNLIYPRIVGSSIGLPGIWVVVAITIGGGFGGILGMMLGVPLMATAYRLLRQDMTRRTQLPTEEKEA